MQYEKKAGYHMGAKYIMGISGKLLNGCFLGIIVEKVAVFSK